MIHRLTGALEFQAQALSLRAERQRHLASNIANADTPGYVARDFDFANALREATSGLGGPRNAPGAAPSNELGAPVAGNLLREPGQRYEPRVAYATPSQTNLDANTVDMDRERASFADNAVKYEATLRFINGSVRTMLDAMKGHHQ